MIHDLKSHFTTQPFQNTFDKVRVDTRKLVSNNINSSALFLPLKYIRNCYAFILYSIYFISLLSPLQFQSLINVNMYITMFYLNLPENTTILLLDLLVNEHQLFPADLT